MTKNVSLTKEIFERLVADFPEVTLAYLFGSQVKGEVGPLSDYDIAVLFESYSDGGELRGALGSALATALGTRIDVVFLNRAPIELAYAIIAEGIIIYERDPSTRIDYESKVMGLYGDYLPTLRAQKHDILNGDEYEIRVQRYREALGRTERALSEIREARKNISRPLRSRAAEAAG
jgi:predicted nucleotidyltransferase